MKRYCLIALFLIICLLTGSSCAKNGREKDREDLTNRYEVAFHEIDLANGEEFLDILPDGSGYLLLIGRPGFSSSLISLDENLQPTGKKVSIPVAEKTIRIEREGADYYSLSLESTAPESSVYVFSRNGETLGRAIQPGYAEPDSWKSITVNGIFFVLDLLTGTMYANGESLGTAIEDTGDKTAYPVCFLKIGSDGFLVVSKTRFAVGSQDINDLSYREPLEEKSCLLPLTKEGNAFLASEILSDEQSIEFPETNDCVSENSSIFTISGSILHRLEDNEEETLCNLLHFGLSAGTSYRRILPAGDGRVFLLGSGFLAEVRKKAEDSAEKQVITLGTACDATDWETESAVARFNRQNKLYSIGITRFQSVEAMNLAILNGELDGIFSDDILAMRNYAASGLFMNLEETVPELFQNGVLFDNLVDAARIDGICYYLPRSFHLYLPSAPEALLKEKLSFESYGSCADLLSAQGNTPLKGVTRRFMLRDLSVSTLDYWINWTGDSPRFDSPEFIDLLSFCKRFALDNDEVWANDYSQGIFQITQISTVLDNMDPYGNRLVFPKLPGIEHASISSPAFLAFIDGKDYVKDAAALFLRYYFGEYDWIGASGGIRNAMKFSLVQEETRILLLPPEDAEGNSSPNDTSSENTIDKTWVVIREANHYRYCDGNELIKVIFEEGLRYLQDEITAEKAAEYIQNRISVYLAEKR